MCVCIFFSTLSSVSFRFIARGREREREREERETERQRQRAGWRWRWEDSETTRMGEEEGRVGEKEERPSRSTNTLPKHKFLP